MKTEFKVVIVCIAAILSCNVNAQSSNTFEKGKHAFGVGIHSGIVLGNLDDAYSSYVGADVYYLYGVSNRFFVGASTGFSNYFGKTISESGIDTDVDDLQFIPVTASIRFNPFKNFFMGPDVGYAIGINDGNDGGFYISPRASYVLNGKFLLHLGYRSISLDDNLGAIQFGIGYNF